MSAVNKATCCLAILLASTYSTSWASPISGRVELGTGVGEFFEGLNSGVDTSFINTVEFTEDDVTVSVTITAEGFDANENPAPLNASSVASGIGLGSDNDLNTGESIRFTYDAFSATAGPSAPPIDPSSIQLTLSGIFFGANFDPATESVLFTGVGAGNESLDTSTQSPFFDFNPPVIITEGDAFTVEATATDAINGISLLFLSQAAEFSFLPQDTIPEPASFGLALLGLGAVAIRRRR